MAKLKRIKVPELAYGPVSVWWDSEHQEYLVKVKDKPLATYHTQDKADALTSAQRMRNTLRIEGQAVKTIKWFEDSRVLVEACGEGVQQAFAALTPEQRSLITTRCTHSTVEASNDTKRVGPAVQKEG